MIYFFKNVYVTLAIPFIIIGILWHIAKTGFGIGYDFIQKFWEDHHDD